MEELGRGAHGKVHKGVLKELPKREVFLKPRELRVDTSEGRLVAIKVLLGEEIIHVQFIFFHFKSIGFSIFVLLRHLKI